MAAEGDFAGHGEFGADRNVGQGGNHGGDHRYACRRAVLGNRASGNVDMHIGLLIEVGIEAQFDRIRPDPGQRGLRGLLHHVAHLAGDREMPSALGDVCLDEQDVAANGRPSQTDHDARPFHALLYFLFKLELRRTQQFNHHFGRYGQPRHFSFQDAPGMFAADAGNLALEVANAGFTRVMAHDVVQRRIFKLDLIRL